ncbi:MAG: methylated-DNA--[protein]-cysteine S-methyltransferase [Nitrospirota bacterium]|nr:methylated-DNA--[protein]-cysteine S-methyltransferase [Nitrospirota bacterium]
MSCIELSEDYRRIERAIHFLDAHVFEQPSLEDVAEEIGLSPFHAQRVFTRWAGISPKRFLGLLTVGHAKAALQAGESVLDAAYDVGLSGPSRLHDLFVAQEAMTPGEYKDQGAGIALRYGCHPTPFGDALILATERGIAGFSFVDDDPGEALEEARERWPLSRLVEDQATTEELIDQLFLGTQEERPKLLLKGTNFQVKVWSALLRVPTGRLVSYLDLATAIGQPMAVRAVGRALSGNPVGFIVPCHRVIRATGALGDYRWGRTRRRAMLAWEAAKVTAG